MADIEQPGPGPDRQVLIADAGVLDRHVPATELDHARAKRAMPGVERCLLQTARNSLSHRGNNRNCTIRCRLWTRTSNGTIQLGHRSNLDLGASPPDPLHA